MKKSQANKPKPHLIETKEGWKVTDGWIGNSFFRVVTQPSEKTLRYLDNLWLELSEIKQGKERKVS